MNCLMKIYYSIIALFHLINVWSSKHNLAVEIVNEEIKRKSEK